MSVRGSYKAGVEWERDRSEVFVDGRYSRRHTWSFDCEVQIPASSSPLVVRTPLSAEDAVDPEEALVASVSACHMLWFLSISAAAGWVVNRYKDDAVGEIGLDSEGKEWMKRITLRPRIAFEDGCSPAADELSRLHEAAHHECAIARSVRSEVVVEA